MNIPTIGIDCGKEGALCVLAEQIEFFDTPTMIAGDKRVYDVLAMGRTLKQLRAQPNLAGLHVFLEKQQAMPPDLHGRTQGVATSFQVGVGYGVWLGLLGALEIPYTLVHSTTWKRAMMADMPKDKDASRIKAIQMFPAAADDLKLKKHHNRAEALLLAEWGRRSLNLGITATPRPATRKAEPAVTPSSNSLF